LQRVVVLSDLHFGDEGAMLSHREVVERLVGELEELGDIDMLVLLGDVWDLWRADLATAARAGGAFFQAMSEWRSPREVVLVVGNHDYHLRSYCEERDLRRDMGWENSEGDCDDLIEDARGGGGSRPGDGLALSLAYPFLSLEVQGKTLLFMHGHHLDFFSPSFWWAKTSWMARWVLGSSRAITISDIDRLNKPFFELLTVTAHVPEFADRQYRFYRLLRSMTRLLRFQSKSGASPRRYTSVENNRREARALLGNLLPGYTPDALVFGHTHREGFGRIRVGERRVLLVNSGCWLRGDGEGRGGTYLVIEDGIRMRLLGGPESTISI
jgi:UDP-2,3-diacylglucosamine pyrophosphatase LpxH